MLVKKTTINSNGKKIKKFVMPKFPSALVIIFFVLLFVVVLSWIPHKGWVDTSNPFLTFNEVGVYSSKDIALGLWEDPTIWSGEITSESILILNLTPEGLIKLSYWLEMLDVKNAQEIMVAAINGIRIDQIVLGIDGSAKDWNEVGINYSGLSFTASIADYSTNIVVDKIFATQIETLINESISFNFNILSASLFVGEDFTLTFSSGTIDESWFNFWGTNYYVADVNGRYGLLNIPFLILAGFFHAAGVVLFLLCITAFIEVMLQSGALEAGTSSLVKKLKGKELLLLPVLFTLFCVAGTTFGMQEETLGLIPLIIPFLVLAGFDTMTGFLVIVVGTTTGISASVLDPFSIGVMSSSLSVETGAVDPITIGTGIAIRIIMFVVFLIAGAAFCTWYGHRSRKGKDFVAEPKMYEENKKWAQSMLGESHKEQAAISKRQSVGLIIFAMTFGIMIFSVLPWTTWFDNLGSNPNGFWTLLSSIFYSKILLGDWYFLQLSLLFLASAFILGLVFGMKKKETAVAVVKGMQSAIKVSMILVLSRAVAIVLSYSGLTTAMIAMMFAGSGQETFSLVGLAWILFPVFAFLAIFIPSTSGLAGITGPLIAPVIWQLASTAEDPEAMFRIYATVVMVTYPLAQGTINMFMPTTGIVVAQAEVSNVDFGKALPILAGVAVGTMILGMIIISTSIPIMLR